MNTTYDPYVMERTRRAYIIVLGTIWMPKVEASLTIQLGDHDLENIGEINRSNVEAWLMTHSGDFSFITDFYCVVGAKEVPWAKEDSECKYMDTIYPGDE
jgi:hypothetical protein